MAEERRQWVGKLATAAFLISVAVTLVLHTKEGHEIGEVIWTVVSRQPVAESNRSDGDGVIEASLRAGVTPEQLDQAIAGFRDAELTTITVVCRGLPNGRVDHCGLEQWNGSQSVANAAIDVIEKRLRINPLQHNGRAQASLFRYSLAIIPQRTGRPKSGEKFVPIKDDDAKARQSPATSLGQPTSPASVSGQSESALIGTPRSNAPSDQSPVADVQNELVRDPSFSDLTAAERRKRYQLTNGRIYYYYCQPRNRITYWEDGRFRERVNSCDSSNLY